MSPDPSRAYNRLAVLDEMCIKSSEKSATQLGQNHHYFFILAPYMAIICQHVHRLELRTFFLKILCCAFTS